MSGFALLYDSQNPVTAEEHALQAFEQSVADYKVLNSTSWKASSRHCVAVKFDTASALHRGITTDAQTGSWLFAVGTVMDGKDQSADGNLQSLLTRYLEQGITAFQSLDGPFALAVYNKPADKLLIVSDPFGFISVFYARRGRKVYVATSSLAVAKAIQATPSEYGIYLFLSTGNVYGKTTLWQEVERLSAGTALEITPAGVIESTYWSPTIKKEITRLSLTETVDYGLDVLSQLMRDYLTREGKTWADLTGGFDTRLVTMMLHHCGLPFMANCQGPNASPDVRISSHIAQKLGWDYQHFMLPDDWGIRRYEGLSRALGKGDGHLDVFKLSRVLWDQDQRAREYGTPIWGFGGEVWRGTIWKQEFWNAGRTSTVNYDRLVDYRLVRPVDYTIFSDVSRIKWIRAELKSHLRSVGERYSGLPNTFKLDCIFAYKTTGHTGSHISAVMGLQRAIAPLFFKDSIAYVISTHYKCRQHSRLVRLLIEKVNPVLAGIETTAGGPALPMRAANFYKFLPYWLAIGKQLVRKTSREFFGRSLLAEDPSEAATYPLTHWRQITLDCIDQDHLLNHAQMRSGCLYDAERLKDFLQRARTEEFDQETLLSRVVTVEMALRSVGASF